MGGGSEAIQLHLQSGWQLAGERLHGQPGVILASCCWMCVNISGGNSLLEIFHHSVCCIEVQYYNRSKVNVSP